MSQNAVIVDVRADIRAGREPFSRIMAAVAGLVEDQDLVLLAPFEPMPLYSMLGQRGFGHASKALDNGDWEIRFSRKLETIGGSQNTRPAPAEDTAVSLLEVDARGLEPPQPLVKILEALATLPNGANLRAHTDRRPMHLYAQLEERGFTAETAEQPDGSFITYVSRR
jgi:uncharacterized protein (DUF2249 family)